MKRLIFLLALAASCGVAIGSLPSLTDDLIDVRLSEATTMAVVEVRLHGVASYSAVEVDIEFTGILLGAHFLGAAPAMDFDPFHALAPSGLNESLTDGDATLIVLGSIGDDLYAAPEGQLIATIYLAVQPGEAGCVSVLDARVWSGDIPNWIITGEVEGWCPGQPPTITSQARCDKDE